MGAAVLLQPRVMLQTRSGSMGTFTPHLGCYQLASACKGTWRTSTFTGHCKKKQTARQLQDRTNPQKWRPKTLDQLTGDTLEPHLWWIEPGEWQLISEQTIANLVGTQLQVLLSAGKAPDIAKKKERNANTKHVSEPCSLHHSMNSISSQHNPSHPGAKTTASSL